MGILFAILAGMLMPLTNLTVRKSIDLGASAKGYFVFQMLSSFFFALLMGPLRTGDLSLPLPTLVLGAIAGILLSCMLFTLGKAAEKGPPGFTFAILNSATILPGLLMFFCFGPKLGYDYRVWHAFGSFLVLVGLFLAAKGLNEKKEMRPWLFFSIAAFSFHVLLLSLYQFRALLLHPSRPFDLFPFFSTEAIQNSSFTPCMFFVAGLLQTAIFLKTENRTPFKKEMFYGFTGGLTNLGCTLLLVVAAEQANPLENAMIFPIFSVVGIVLTNAWGQKLYQESVNWKACQLSLFGLLIATVDWSSVAAAIGF